MSCGKYRLDKNEKCGNEIGKSFFGNLSCLLLFSSRVYTRTESFHGSSCREQSKKRVIQETLL